VFCFFIGFFQIALLNVLTGIFVERACELSGLDRDLVIQAESLRRESFLEEMKHIFEDADADADAKKGAKAGEACDAGATDKGCAEGLRCHLNVAATVGVTPAAKLTCTASKLGQEGYTAYNVKACEFSKAPADDFTADSGVAPACTAGNKVQTQLGKNKAGDAITRTTTLKKNTVKSDGTCDADAAGDGTTALTYKKGSADVSAATIGAIKTKTASW